MAEPIGNGDLWPRVAACYARALACGALQRIDTRLHRVEDGGVAFSVRVAASLRRKARERDRRPPGAKPFNPFLPPEPELTVGALGPHHLAVLNKFNVVERHLLLVTRDFVPQERLLDRADFEALCRCLREGDGLGFYNGGTVAGASQGHKHLQLVPLPLSPGGSALPIEALPAHAPAPQGITRLAPLPFRHRFMPLAAASCATAQEMAGVCLDAYRAMLAQLGIDPVQRDDGAYQGSPYNLLVTRRWMMLVPRRAEHAEGVSLNAMAFAGSLFVLDEAALERVRAVGPMRLLQAVT